MEVQKLKEISMEEIPRKHQQWISKMTAVFQRGVAEAKAENERLGIPSRDSEGDYSTEDLLAKAPFVAESDPE